MDKANQQAVLEASQGSGAWDVLSTMLPTADWSAAARDGEIVPAVNCVEIPSSPSSQGEGEEVEHRNGETRGDVYDRLSRRGGTVNGVLLGGTGSASAVAGSTEMTWQSRRTIDKILIADRLSSTTGKASGTRRNGWHT